MNTNAYGSLMGNNTPPTTIVPMGGFMGQNRIGGPSQAIINQPGSAETLENKYSRLYDQYYDTNQGVFDFSGASGELSSRDFFGGLENDFIKREADRQNKENFLSGFFRAGDSLKPLRDYGGNSPRGQVSGQTLGNMVKEGTYKFPSSTVQKAREASSALPVTQAMSSIFS
tara:strand:- start:236 stop:748 length:513 start_codon:yes stop_codon:yes gene_type:complete